MKKNRRTSKDEWKVVATAHHSLFCRTRRAMSVGGFRITIHNITDVAADKAYLILS